MAIPTWQSATTYFPGAAGTSAVVTLPASLAANDIVVVTLYKENTGAVTLPDGTWTQKVSVSTTAPQAHYLFWKRCAGGESGTVTFSWTGSVWRAAAAHRITGCQKYGDPIEAAATNFSNTGVTTLAVTRASTVPNSLLMWSGTDFQGGASWTAPTADGGYTERVDIDNLSDASRTTTTWGGGTTASTTGTSNVSGPMTAILYNLLPNTYINHVTLAAPTNGTTSHTVDTTGTGGTTVDGSTFTPTSGRLLLCFVEGAVTSTTPTGWSLPTNGSAINNTGLYVFTRTASGTSADQVATTHNGSNYAVVFDFYEFAAGSTFVGSASATGVAYNGGAGPTLSSLTGTNWTAGASGMGRPVGQGHSTVTWDSGTEEVDTSVAFVSTDGYCYSLTYTVDNAASSQAYAATFAFNLNTVERLVVAVTVGAGAAPASIPPILMMPARSA